MRKKRDSEIDSFLARNPILDKDEIIIKEKKAQREIAEKRKRVPKKLKGTIGFGEMPKLDLHGKFERQAEEALRDFVDKHINSSARVLVVHGKGSNSEPHFGPILKHMVERMVTGEFKSYIENWYHPEERLGGEGATVIEFNNS